MLFLTQELKTKNVATILYWGNRTKHDFTIISDFENLGIKLHLASDDGSSGFKGTVTELFQAKLNNYNEARIEIFACGPNPMLNELKKISADKKISCQISLETMMACGFGVCLGCNITSNLKSEAYKYVCKHGPVFDSGEIELSA